MEFLDKIKLAFDSAANKGAGIVAVGALNYVADEIRPMITIPPPLSRVALGLLDGAVFVLSVQLSSM